MRVGAQNENNNAEFRTFIKKFDNGNLNIVYLVFEYTIRPKLRFFISLRTKKLAHFFV